MADITVAQAKNLWLIAISWRYWWINKPTSVVKKVILNLRQKHLESPDYFS